MCESCSLPDIQYNTLVPIGLRPTDIAHALRLRLFFLKTYTATRLGSIATAIHSVDPEAATRFLFQVIQPQNVALYLLITLPRAVLHRVRKSPCKIIQTGIFSLLMLEPTICDIWDTIGTLVPRTRTLPKPYQT